MAKNNNLQDFLKGIADTIREENGTTELINPQDFESKITEIADKLRNILQGTVTEITPEMLTGITTLRPLAFAGYDNLTKITLPEGVTDIGAGAFDGCTRLVKLNLPNSLEQFSPDIFFGPQGTMPDNLEFNYDDNGFMYLGNDANPYVVLWYGEIYDEGVVFPVGMKILSGGYQIYVGIPTLNIPDQVVSIETNSLSGDVEVINCGSGLKHIANGAFDSCDNLQQVNVSESNPFYSSASGILYDKNKTTFVFVPKKIATADIPSSVTKIPNNAFYVRTMLTSVTIPNGIVAIGTSAFDNCASLASITIPNSVTSIGSSAFRGCTSLTSITIPNSVTSIGTNIFYNCTNLAYAEIPEVTGYMFYGCKSLKSVNILDGSKTIGDYAFYNCSSLTSASVPNSVATIGTNAFYGCSNLNSITIGSNVKSVGSTAFKGCSALTAVYISDLLSWCNIKFSKSYSNPLTFAKHLYLGSEKLTRLEIPNGVEIIGDYAFYNCADLTSVSIPSSVTKINSYSFGECTGLTAVYISDLVKWCKINFSGNPLQYAKHLYLNGAEITNLVIPDEITNIRSDTFRNCSGLTSVTIHDRVTSIEYCAFAGCTGLTSITIPNSVTNIGIGAFQGCTGLIQLTIPSSVTSIGISAFSSCTSLVSVKYEGNVIVSSAGIFDGCSKVSKYDFRNATSVPTLSNKSYLGHAAGCKIIVPDALHDSWKAATNWSALTDVVWVKASEYTEE